MLFVLVYKYFRNHRIQKEIMVTVMTEMENRRVGHSF